MPLSPYSSSLGKANIEVHTLSVLVDTFGTAAIPEDFLKRLATNKKAKAFFATLNKTNLYSIAYRLQTAKKPETRDKRIQAIIEKLARGEKFH